MFIFDPTKKNPTAIYRPVEEDIWVSQFTRVRIRCAPSYYTIKCKGSSGKRTQADWPKTRLNEPNGDVNGYKLSDVKQLPVYDVV